MEEGEEEKVMDKELAELDAQRAGRISGNIGLVGEEESIQVIREGGRLKYRVVYEWKEPMFSTMILELNAWCNASSLRHGDRKVFLVG